MKELKGWVRPVTQHLTPGRKPLLFMMNLLLCSRLGSDRFHFSWDSDLNLNSGLSHCLAAV